MTEAEEKEKAEKAVKETIPGMHMRSLPDARDSGEVMIELPTTMPFDDGVNGIIESLEAKGFKVSWRREGDASFEDASEGIDTGRPVAGTSSGDNNIINGVSLPKVDDHSVYKVVKLVRPEDTVKDGESGLLYLMNGNGDVKEYLQNEGFLVVDEEEQLHTAILENGEA